MLSPLSSKKRFFPLFFFQTFKEFLKEVVNMNMKEVLKIPATEVAWIWKIWQNFIQNHCWASDSVPHEKEILRPPPWEVSLFPRSQGEASVRSCWERDLSWISPWQEDKYVTYEVSFHEFLIILQISFYIYSIYLPITSFFMLLLFFFFFFYNIQTYNNMPNPKLLVAVRVAELLIYLHTPSKLGDVGQSPHTSFFFITHKHIATR